MSLCHTSPKSLFFPNRIRDCAAVLAVTLLILFGASACGTSRAASPSSDPGGSPMAVEEMPAELGHGFPVASVPDETQTLSSIKAGSSAPQFTLEFKDGRSLSLADFQGRPVMINFWATWCPPCRTEMPEIVRQAEADDDLIVLAVNVQEDLKQVRPFAEEFRMSMPVVMDEAGDLRDLYLIRGMPTSLFIDRQGVIVSMWEGMLSPAQLESMLDGIR